LIIDKLIDMQASGDGQQDLMRPVYDEDKVIDM
jgi:hypothetical protein